jgi:hypothetical protein
MTTKLAATLLNSARAATGLLRPMPPTPGDAGDATAAAAATGATLSHEVEARIQAAINKTLEYHRTHRPPNTARNYAPKQREWKSWREA